MRFHAAFLTLAAALALSACATSAQDSGRPSVLTAAYPFTFIVERVGGDVIDATSLVSRGVEAHDVELSPRQVAQVHDADLVVFVEGFQTAVDDAVSSAGLDDDVALDLGTVVDLLSSEHDHDDDDGHHGHDHDHDDIDPHFWLDPQRMITATEAVQSALADIDPEHAGDFRANADALIAELGQLDQSFATGLATCERQTIVTAHAAFSYLADAYGLTQVPIAGLDPAQGPSSGQLAEISQLVRTEGITTIFTEELAPEDTARTVAEATGADMVVLDPIEGLSDATADQDYVTLMQQNLAAIREANSCS